MKLVKDQNKPIISNDVSDEEAKEALEKILKWIGEEQNREGLLETNKRVVKAYIEYVNVNTENQSKM